MTVRTGILVKRLISSMALLRIALAVSFLFVGCGEEKTEITLPPTHPTAFLNPNSPDFHGNIAFARGNQSCRVCHGADLNGGEVGVSCVECHIREGGCTTCHGGADNNTGAPPYGLEGEIDDTSLAVGAHSTHLMGGSDAAPVTCGTCHMVPENARDSGHIDLASPVLDSVAEIIWGGLEEGGEAVWDRQNRTCTGSYCHGNFEGGDTSNAPVWTENDQALCGSCHDIGDDPASLLWEHELHIDLLDLQCYHCHGGVVDSNLNIISPSSHINGIADTTTAICDACHTPGVNSCALCHGGYDNITGAPPYGLSGETGTTTLAVGAHTAHLDASSSASLECDYCHLVPARVLDTAHLDLGGPVRDSIAEIVWSGLADNGLTVWDRNTGECSGSYCHGNFLGGDSTNVPVWTGLDQANCGSCHDVVGDSASLTLLGSHKFHVGTAAIKCSECHANVVDDDLNIISNSLHVNGEIETLTTNPALCDACHGFGTSCIVCHGGQDNNSGAPPLGLDGETSTTELAVGAHTAHLRGNLITDGVACSECHTRPVVPLSEGHLDSDGIPDMDFGPLAGNSSSWNRNTRLCSSTYCHGNFPGGYGNNTPDWTAGSGQAACGSCHDAGTQPEDLGGKHKKHVQEEGVGCFECHSGTVNAELLITGKDLHIDGQNEVIFSSGSGTYANGGCSNIGCHEDEDWD